MNLSDLLPPERVREIAQQYAPPYGSMTELRMAAINAAAPEIARAVLEWAAKDFERQADAAPSGAYRDALWHLIGGLRHLAKEITNAK